MVKSVWLRRGLEVSVPLVAGDRSIFLGYFCCVYNEKSV